MKNICGYLIAISCAALIFAPTLAAQSGGAFAITQSVVSNGGGESSSGSFGVTGTSSQPLVGTEMANGNFGLSGGFWPEFGGVAAPASISGTVTYGNSATTRFVSNVLMSGAGSPNVSTTTGVTGMTAGQYSLSGFGAGSYTVSPTKSGGVNGVTSFDAARIAQHVSGSSPLTGNQLLVADVSNNGVISSFDAAQIARFVTSSPPYGITGTWKFIPVNRLYASVTASINGEDYIALLMGEVSGNWTNSGARAVNGPPEP